MNIILLLIFCASSFAYNNARNITSINTIPEYIIDLDLPPEERWAHIVPKYSESISNVIETAYEELPWAFSRIIKYLAKTYFDDMPNHMDEYGKEIIGIANYTGINLYEIVLYNIFNEIFSLCTSVLVNSEYQDTIIHARNLDFGVFMEGIVPLLKDITISLVFMKNNTVQYRAHTFAGFVGIFTGMKPYKYSITIVYIK